MRFADRPEIEFKVGYEVVESAKFADSMTSRVTLNSISGRSADHKAGLLLFLVIFFSFFWARPMSMKIGQVPNCQE